MKQSQIDYINFRYLLKGNYRKGVHALRSILADNAQAKAFAENPAAVAVVLSYDKENPDKNAEELYELLTSSSVADLASTTYICSTYSVTTFEELAADAEIMAEVVEDASTMNAIAASEGAMTAMAASETAMTAIAGSETAMTAVTSTDIAMDVIAGSDIALVVIASSETAMAIAVDKEVIMESLASSAAAMASVTTSSATMSIIAASETAMAKIAETSSAMTAVVASDIALNAVIASDTAMTAVVGSDVAMTVAGASADFCIGGIESGYAETLFANETAMATCSSASCLPFIVSDSDYCDAWLAADGVWPRLASVSSMVAADPSSYSGFLGKKIDFKVVNDGALVNVTFGAVIVALGHNEKAAGGKAGFTFQSEKCLSSNLSMNSSNTTTGGWASSAGRTRIEEWFLPGFPEDVLSALATTKVYYNTAANSSLSTCEDSLWLPSEKEVFGSSSCDSAGTQFAWYKNGGSNIKSYGSSAINWWLRSVYSPSDFRVAYSDGAASNGSASYSRGVAPCFCI